MGTNFSATPAQAADLGTRGLWTNQFGRPAGDGRGLGTAVAYDSEGFMHVVWFGGSSEDNWRVYYSNNRSGNFSSSKRISTRGGIHRDPDIAVGSNGRVHVIYAEDKDADIYYVESLDYGQNWREPERINIGSGAKAYEPSIGVDANNTVHAVWADRRWGKQQATYSARAVTGNWTEPGKVSGDTFDRYPEVATTGSGGNVRVYIVYQGREGDSNFQSDFDVYMATSVGSRFLPPVNVSRDDGIWSLTPSIATNGVNELYIAWDTQDNGHDITFVRSVDQGQTFTRQRNIAKRNGLAIDPSVAFGNSGNIPRVHISWVEDFTALYLLYEPQTNSFGDSIEQVADLGRADEADIAASNVTDEIALGFQASGGSSQYAYVYTKGAGTVVSAIMTINDGQPFTNKTQLNVKLANVRGAPTRMRYTFNRAPNDSDPWVAVQTNFDVPIPASPSCTYFFNLQLETADGRRSGVLVRDVVVDSAVQASVDMRNPYFNGEAAPFLPREGEEASIFQTNVGGAEYTRREFFYASISNAGECSALARFYLGNSQNPYPLTNEGFINVLPLPGGSTEGPRAVGIRVQDTLGNETIFTRSLVLDRTPPQVKSGTLVIKAPTNGLGTVLADLEFENLVTTDNLYPGGRWGVYVTNATDPTLRDSDPSLQWRSVQVLQSGEKFVVSDWSVVAGIAKGVGDTSLAGKDIQVRVKFIDGAGNVSAETLTATVKLAQNYTPVRNFVSALTR